MSSEPSGALVFFGASGDLAFKQILPALHALVRRRRLEVPVVGVAKAGWSVEQLRQRARDSVAEHTALDDRVFGRLASLLHYVDGDHREPSTLYAALRLRVHSWRWAVVPFLVRTGKCLPVTATEVTGTLLRPSQRVFEPSRRWRRTASASGSTPGS